MEPIIIQRGKYSQKNDLPLQPNEARKLINSVRKDLNLNRTNTAYSNINNSKAHVWWLEPANEKFKSDLFLVLNYSENTPQILIVIKIPINSIKDPERRFCQRTDNGRDASKLEITVSEKVYIDRIMKFDFTPMVIDKIKYDITYEK